MSASRSRKSVGSKDIGRDVGEKGKSLFSPDDWNCKNCHNINWARRTTCNICGTPRYNNLGQRTGYGGGFMERDEVVEYRGRRNTDSDDEFDEFGRKKKQFRQSGDGEKAVSSNTHPSPDQEKRVEAENSESDDHDSEEEDEEESGDDADLSKYAICSDTEDADNGTDIPKHDVNGQENKQGEKSGNSDSSDSSSSSSSSSSSNSGSPRSRHDSSSSSEDEPQPERTTHRRSRDTEGRDRSRFERAVLIQASPSPIHSPVFRNVFLPPTTMLVIPGSSGSELATGP